MSSILTQSQLCTATLISSFVHCSNLILAITCIGYLIYYNQNLAQWITSVGELTDIYIVLAMKGYFKRSCRKTAWVSYEPATTEFCSYTLTGWGIRPWIQLSLRANFLWLLEINIFFQSSSSVSATAFVSLHI